MHSAHPEGHTEFECELLIKEALVGDVFETLDVMCGLGNPYPINHGVFTSLHFQLQNHQKSIYNQGYSKNDRFQTNTNLIYSFFFDVESNLVI